MLAWYSAANVDQKSQEILVHKYKFGDIKRKKVDEKSTQPDKTRYEKPRHGRRAKTPDDNRNKKSTTAHEMATDEDTSRAETTDDELVVYKKVKRTTNDTKNQEST
jgi:hypothetical protein